MATSAPSFTQCRIHSYEFSVYFTIKSFGYNYKSKVFSASGYVVLLNVEYTVKHLVCNLLLKTPAPSFNPPWFNKRRIQLLSDLEVVKPNHIIQHFP